MTTTTTGEIVHNPDSRDHFEVLGLPRRLQVDEKLVSRHFHALSREYHPDFHQSGSPSERAASLRRTAAVNDAYNALRDPFARGRWWLEFNGGKLNSNPQVPPDLVMLVFEVQELLEQARTSGRDDVLRQVRAQQEIVEQSLATRMEALQQNFAAWDAMPEGSRNEELLVELQRILAELSYVRTLLRSIHDTTENVGA